LLIRTGRKPREDTGSNIGAGGGGVVDMAKGGPVYMTTRGWGARVRGGGWSQLPGRWRYRGVQRGGDVGRLERPYVGHSELH